MSAAFDRCNTASVNSQWDAMSNPPEDHTTVTPGLCRSWIVYNSTLLHSLYSLSSYSQEVMTKPRTTSRTSPHVSRAQCRVFLCLTLGCGDGRSLSALWPLVLCREKERAHSQCSGPGCTSQRQTAATEDGLISFITCCPPPLPKCAEQHDVKWTSQKTLWSEGSCGFTDSNAHCHRQCTSKPDWLVMNRRPFASQHPNSQTGRPPVSMTTRGWHHRSLVFFYYRGG